MKKNKDKELKKQKVQKKTKFERKKKKKFPLEYLTHKW
jgi:hypothetical protein